MAFRLPNGSTFDFAATYSADVEVTGVSNALEAVVTAPDHTFANGDIVVITSGWTRLNGRSFRVKSVVADASFVLEGMNTLNTTQYPVGGGVGSVKKVATWVQIPQITDVSFSGGEQQFTTFGFLEENEDRQIPTTKSPSSMTITIADDPDQPFVPVVEAADEDMEARVQRLNLANGDILLYNSIASFTRTPTLTRNELMTRVLTLSLQGAITRYKKS